MEYAYAWSYPYARVRVFAMLLAQAVLTQMLTQSLCLTALNHLMDTLFRKTRLFKRW